MRSIDRVFDDGFDDVANDSHRLQPWRLITAAVAAPLVAALLGTRAGLIWAVALAVSETWTWAATRPFAARNAIGLRHRVGYLASMAALNLTWVGLSLAFWLHSAPGASFSALLIWCCILLGGISFAFRSSLAVAILAGPVTLTMVAAPVLAPRFEGAQQVITIVGLLACAGCAWVSARRNYVASRAVVAATVELAAQKAAAEAANRAKSAFLAMMSHEIRTPMNGVLGMAHALEATALNERQSRYVDTLLQSGDGLMAILDDVLDLARIEAGDLEIVAEPFNLPDVVLTVVGLWREVAVGKGLVLTCEISPAAPVWVTGDGVRVRQVLLNLLSNAIKFTDRGEVRLALDAAPDGVALAVSDTGPGMDAASRAALLRSSSPAEAGAERPGGGVGLGLAICRNLADLMGGRIEVEAAPDAGSTVRLVLPALSCEPPQTAHAADPPGLQALRVLIVDDNPANRAVAVALLEALDATPRTAPGGEEALAILREAKFDAVLLDIHMPGMDGIEVAARIRAGEGGDPTVPIIALTADAIAGARERLLSQGFDDYLTKPISPMLLAQALARVGTRS